MNETNAELEEMDTIEARDEAYERSRDVIDEFDEDQDYGTDSFYDYDTSMYWDTKMP